MNDFVDVINDYRDGQTGTITLANGESVNYSLTTNNVSDDHATAKFNGFEGAVNLKNTSQNAFQVNFDQPVANVVLAATGSDRGEKYIVTVDGVDVDLNDLLAQGLVTFNDDPSHTTDSNGALRGVGSGGASTKVTYIQFNYPITSIGVKGGGGSQTGRDFFEIGVNDATDVVCFCTGTLIETETGPQAVETLEQGARILTQDGTFATLRCVVSTTLQSWELALKPKLRPIWIAAGALGKGLPQQDLHVSPQHRMLVSSKIANRVCDANEVLVAAKKLTSLPGIRVDDSIDEVSYYHLIFDEHQIIYANGAPTESLYLGEEALKALTPRARVEVLALFPELLLDSPPLPVVAAPIPSGRHQKQLVARHAKNKRDLLSNYPRMDKQA